MPSYYVRFKNNVEKVSFVEAKLSQARELAEAREGVELMPEIPQAYVYNSTTDPSLVIAELSEEEVERLRAMGHEVIEPPKYRMATDLSFDALFPKHTTGKKLDDVLAQIKADKVSDFRGAGIHIAIIDSGVCGTRSEFPNSKRSPHSFGDMNADPWVDTVHHGTLVACAATATRAEGGNFDGVAPDATLISYRIPYNTTLVETSITRAYEYLIGLVESETIKSLVINNSLCPIDEAQVADGILVEVIRKAVSLGIVVVFSAGNVLNSQASCSMGTIKGVNSLDEVITVGTVDENNRMDQPPPATMPPTTLCHRNSAGGPGQLSTTVKPDCVAPTYGEIMVGCRDDSLIWWGTSGAAALVSGLVALMLSKNPGLKPDQVKDIIMKTCVKLDKLEPRCVGAGLIDCLSAVSAVPEP